MKVQAAIIVPVAGVAIYLRGDLAPLE